MPLAWVDPGRTRSVDYEELVADVNAATRLPVYLQSSDPYEVLRDVVTALAYGVDVTVLDADFSTRKLESLGISAADRRETRGIPDDQPFDSPESLVETIRSYERTCTLGLYTSGTTGTPTRVEHSLASLTRRVKTGPEFADHVWAYSYNPTHFAGFQVLFQALFNRNPMVFVFEATPDDIAAAIHEHGITHISATPTFYRLRVARLDDQFPTVRRLTFGGEKFDPTLAAILRERFPNAAVRNVYASTEGGSLLESDDDLFSVPESLSDRIRVSEQDELVLHRSLLGDTSSLDGDDEWYHTGDLVEYVDGGRFRIRGRESDLINVGGYDVNPHEVEGVLRTVEGVVDAAVHARPNSVLGHVLVATVQPAAAVEGDDLEKRLRDELGTSCQPWEVPRRFEFVDTIGQTRTGKKVRA